VPLTARGVHAVEYLAPWKEGESGLATWVIGHNEAVLVGNQRTDPRVNHLFGEPEDGPLIVVPLLGPHGALGVLTLERLGPTARFEEQEFELVKLFAAQVSIALRNAETFQAAQVRARTDDLTGLLNHGTFMDRLGRSVAAATPFGLVMIDLDGFKAVNDSMGHQAGDRLLREIAAAIQGAARETDSVFRYGGDEFTLILPGSSAAGLASAAERLRVAVALVGSRWQVGDAKMSASLGTAAFPADGETAESVLLAADRACFFAKRRGRGGVATAQDGRRLAGELVLSEPTPVDPPTVGAA
jgi:diguanylate cyclase (GGDEF)-like protein